jgi:hypothetical protein
MKFAGFPPADAPDFLRLHALLPGHLPDLTQIRERSPAMAAAARRGTIARICNPAQTGL